MPIIGGADQELLIHNLNYNRRTPDPHDDLTVVLPREPISEITEQNNR